MLQKNVNVPRLSATNSMSTAWLGGRRSLMPYSGNAKPCATSMLLTWIITVSPLFTVITLGSNSNCFAIILTSTIFAAGPAGVDCSGNCMGSICCAGCCAGITFCTGSADCTGAVCWLEQLTNKSDNSTTPMMYTISFMFSPQCMDG